VLPLPPPPMPGRLLFCAMTRALQDNTAAAAPVAKAAIDVVEEDDEFEEFENENWGAEEEDTSDAKQWMDNWEDDDSGDVAFIQKLRDQLRSK
jgi:hypothetical protein